MTREEQIAAIKNGENVTTTTGNATTNNVISVAEKVDENKIETPAEEPVKEPAVEDTQVTEPKVLEETTAEPEIPATTSSESQINFEPDVKLDTDIPLIPIDGIDIGLNNTSTETEEPTVDVTNPIEPSTDNMFNIPSMSPTWEMSNEETQENQNFINSEQSFMNNDQFNKTFEPNRFEPPVNGESDKILEFIESTRKANEKKEIVRHNAITTNPEVAAEVIDGFFNNFPYEEAKERSKEYVFNQTTALSITNGQLKEVHDKEPLHSLTRDKNEAVFNLNQGKISTDEFPGFSNKFSQMDSETSFTDQRSTMESLPSNNFGMQQADIYGNVIQGGFGDEEQNNVMDNSKPFAA